jgi:hypothetical protein
MIEEILLQYEDEKFLKADGFDEAIIGVDETTMRLIYSVRKCIEMLAITMEVDESELEEWESVESKKYELALEYFLFNVSGSYVGEKTPIWCQDNFN